MLYLYLTNYSDIYLQFSDELEEDSPYKKGFEFFKQIILLYQKKYIYLPLTSTDFT